VGLVVILELILALMAFPLIVSTCTHKKGLVTPSAGLEGKFSILLPSFYSKVWTLGIDDWTGIKIPHLYYESIFLHEHESGGIKVAT
jgi:hypothetical protein